MPIETNIALRPVSQSEFGAVAYEVVGHAFTIHKRLGRIFDESIYRTTLSHILASRAVQELCVRLTHAGFEKPYFIDLVVVETLWNGIVVGRQNTNLVAPNTGFEITRLRTEIDSYEKHLLRFLANTTLERMFWVNVVSGKVMLVLLSK